MVVIGSDEISEALQKLANTISTLVDKIDYLTGEVVILWGCMGDICHNYNSRVKDPDLPGELMLEASLEGWQASCTELENLKGMNSEVL